MRITSKGQVTIPQEIRERLGLLPIFGRELADPSIRYRRADKSDAPLRELLVCHFRGGDAGDIPPWPPPRLTPWLELHRSAAIRVHDEQVASRARGLLSQRQGKNYKKGSHGISFDSEIA